MTFFKPAPMSVQHIVIPTSVEHAYINSDNQQVIRNALYMKSYELESTLSKPKTPVIFFHGGPNLSNQEQYSPLVNYLTDKGYTVYIAEIEGSESYARGQFPPGFDLAQIDKGLNLSAHPEAENGLNEFTMNYADDVKDVIEAVRQRHPDLNINLIAHSLGCHHVFRTLQKYPDLNEHINAVSSIAGTYNMGANRFWKCLNDSLLRINSCPESLERLLNNPNIPDERKTTIIKLQENIISNMIDSFYQSLTKDCQDFLLSSKDIKPQITADYNPSVTIELNESVSVCYNNLDNLPPVLLAHALDDSNIPLELTVKLYQQFQAIDHSVSLLTFKEGGHSFIKKEGNGTQAQKILFESIIQFFKQPRKNIQLLETNLSTSEQVTPFFEEFQKKGKNYLIKLFENELKKYPDYYNRFIHPKDEDLEESLDVSSPRL